MTMPLVILPYDLGVLRHRPAGNRERDHRHNHQRQRDNHNKPHRAHAGELKQQKTTKPGREHNRSPHRQPA